MAHEHTCSHPCPMFDGDLAKDMMEAINANRLTLENVSTRLDNLEHTLLGNGQPGKCQIHSNDIVDIKTQLAEDRGRRSILTIVTSFLTALGVAILSWYLRGK